MSARRHFREESTAARLRNCGRLGALCTKFNEKLSDTRVHFRVFKTQGYCCIGSHDLRGSIRRAHAPRRGWTKTQANGLPPEPLKLSLGGFWSALLLSQKILWCGFAGVLLVEDFFAHHYCPGLCLSTAPMYAPCADLPETPSMSCLAEMEGCSQRLWDGCGTW
jgi:hypothetical protein